MSLALFFQPLIDAIIFLRTPLLHFPGLSSFLLSCRHPCSVKILSIENSPRLLILYTLLRSFMNEDSGKSKLTIFAWVIAANIAAWGLYFYFDRFVGIDFDMIRRVNYG